MLLCGESPPWVASRLIWPKAPEDAAKPMAYLGFATKDSSSAIRRVRELYPASCETYSTVYSFDRCGADRRPGVSGPSAFDGEELLFLCLPLPTHLLLQMPLQKLIYSKFDPPLSISNRGAEKYMMQSKDPYIKAWGRRII